MIKRPRTHADRDAYVSKHTPLTGIPAYVEGEATDRLEGHDLDTARDSRPPMSRLGHVERRVDKVERAVEVGFARTDAKLDTMLELAAKAEAERERRIKADAEALERSRKHRIALIGALGTAAAGIIAALAWLA